MATKLISNIRIKWWQNYNKRTRFIDTCILVIAFLLSMPILIHLVTYKENIKGDIVRPYYLAISNKEKFRDYRILRDSTDLSKQITEQTNNLTEVFNADSKETKDKLNKKLNANMGWSYVGFVMIDRKSGDYITNRNWFDDKEYKFGTPEQVINYLVKNDNVVAIKLNEDQKKNYLTSYTDDIEELERNLSNYDVLLFARGENYDIQLNSIKQVFKISFGIFILMLIMSWKKIMMIKHFGKENYMEIFRTEKIKRLLYSPKLILKRRITTKVFLKDKFFVGTIVTVITVSIFYLRFYFGLDLVGLTLTPLFLIVPAIIMVIVYYAMRFVVAYDELESIIDDLNIIKEGNINKELNGYLMGVSGKLANGINDIRISYKDSIEESIKNEKLKTELISNVSHDLKTPLTSIINYVNILQRNDINQEQKKEYIEILENKSHRLKNLIDDLFEVSKMNSGKVELDLNDIDIIQLLYQCIGEVEDLYLEKNIAFKVKSPEELIMQLDGFRISRVFENLANNALKYGMENTRVYVEIKDIGKNVEISFKNISEFELDFDEEEILERFARGDKSRNSQVEGSGLGLAISKSIVELHNGKFKVECEGDLFKAYVILPKVNR